MISNHMLLVIVIGIYRSNNKLSLEQTGKMSSSVELTGKIISCHCH